MLQRMVFAAAHLPCELPNLWEVEVEFASLVSDSKNSSLTPEKAQVLIENLGDLNEEVFTSIKNNAMLLELVRYCPKADKAPKPIGIILMSSRENCQNCNSKLVLRSDRPSPIVIYDDLLGSLPGNHYHKYCRKTGCQFYQYYGYHSQGNTAKIFYDEEWASLAYFVTSQRSAFAMRFLKFYNADLLIGQVSYKQRSDIYNYFHGYSSLSELSEATKEAESSTK